MKPRRYGSRQVSRVSNRTALLTVLRMREKPLTQADKESLARSYGVTVAEVERAAAGVAETRGRVG